VGVPLFEQQPRQNGRKKGSNKKKRFLISKGHVVEKFVQALCYKPEGYGFDSR
jgi:hypothetical protein